jgi:hypothetical protein
MIKYLLLPQLDMTMTTLTVDSHILTGKLGDIFFVSNGKDILAWMEWFEIDISNDLAGLRVIDWDFDGEQR